jgi:uncharacterized protein (TIGR03437 family)
MLPISAILVALTVPAAYGQNTAFTTTSAGNWTSTVAPNSIAAGFAINMVPSTTMATSLPLTTSLGGMTVTVTDSAGVSSQAPLYMVSRGQINYLIPPNAAVGMATVTAAGNGNTYTGTLQIANVAPAIFSANMNGDGVAAGQIISVSPTGQITTQPTYQPIFTPWVIFGYEPLPISLSPGNSVYLVLYGTGIRNHVNPVTATINGVGVPVLYANAQPTLPGLDQINLGPLPQTLAGTGKLTLSIVLTVDGVPANTISIAIQ